MIMPDRVSHAALKLALLSSTLALVIEWCISCDLHCRQSTVLALLLNHRTMAHCNMGHMGDMAGCSAAAGPLAVEAPSC